MRYCLRSNGNLHDWCIMRVIVCWKILRRQTVIGQPLVAHRNPFILSSFTFQEGYSCRLWTTIFSWCAEPENEVILSDPSDLWRYGFFRPTQTRLRANCKNRITYSHIVVWDIPLPFKP